MKNPFCCTKCGSSRIQNGDLEESRAGRIYRTTICLNCSARFNETYTLLAVFELGKDDHEGRSDVAGKYAPYMLIPTFMGGY